jgi:hypothetical protein
MNFAPKFASPPASLSFINDPSNPTLEYSIPLSEIREDTSMKSLKISSPNLGELSYKFDQGSLFPLPDKVNSEYLSLNLKAMTLNVRFPDSQILR